MMDTGCSGGGGGGGGGPNSLPPVLGGPASANAPGPLGRAPGGLPGPGAGMSYKEEPVYGPGPNGVGTPAGLDASYSSRNGE